MRVGACLSVSARGQVQLLPEARLCVELAFKRWPNQGEEDYETSNLIIDADFHLSWGYPCARSTVIISPEINEGERGNETDASEGFPTIFSAPSEWIIEFFSAQIN